MNDSDLDFVDLSSKLLKRVRKKPDDPKQAKKSNSQISSQAKGEEKRKGNPKKDGIPAARLAATQLVNDGGHEPELTKEMLYDLGDPGTSLQTAKDKVLVRMQQFKREHPQKMLHKDAIQPTEYSHSALHQSDIYTTDTGVQPDVPENTDEALALQLQQELDREAASAQIVDLEDGGLFFCQICQKELSHMTPNGRSLHLNRCLDGIEETAPAPPPNSGVLNCPICGKKFKSQKSRSTHLKRCSSDMGVSPAVLLQALQRQAEESQSSAATNTHIQSSSTKRKGPTKPGLHAKNPKKKKHEVLDEDTMMALALSSSMLDQEKEQQRKEEAEEGILAKGAYSVCPLVEWGNGAGRGRGRRKRGTVPRPPPLLLIQKPEAALLRIQERVSELLLRSRPSSPPTPTRCTSTLPGWSGAAPLWQKTALLDEGSPTWSDFYAAELREFFLSSQPVTMDLTSLSNNRNNKPGLSTQLVGEAPLVSRTSASIPTSSFSKDAPHSPAASTQGTEQPLVGSQALRDLMELAEDSMVLTQCSNTKTGQYSDTDPPSNLQLSGFVHEDSQEVNDLCVSGFVPEKAQRCSDATSNRNIRMVDRRRAAGGETHTSVALGRLAADLSGMVNNPQLSDVQLQVDSGEVFYAHTFMFYARCPLLAEMVHESGIGVQEEGLPAAHRVILSDVPGQAVFALLQYLYTSHCSLPASLQPDVLELASRFDLQELQQLCEETTALMHEDHNVNQEGNTQTDEAFMELLRSMWIESNENEDEDGVDSDGGREQAGELQGAGEAEEVISGVEGIQEEQVNEEELEEIYQFAATQRKTEGEDSEQEEENGGGQIFTKLIERHTSTGKPQQTDPRVESNQSLGHSYSRLFSQSWGAYEEGELTSPTAHITAQHHSPPQTPTELQYKSFLQSSDNMSPSPPSTSNLPVTGPSPGQPGEQSGGGDKDSNAVELLKPLTRESRRSHSVCVPVAAESSHTKPEPELIVLSDSSDEVEMDAAVPSQCATRRVGEASSIPTSNQPEVEKNGSPSLSDDPVDPPYCSPEVSWLIPPTPVHIDKSSTSSSTQTRSSMCRTRLFSGVEPSASFSPAFPGHSFKGSTSSHDARTAGSSSSSDHSLSARAGSSEEASRNKEVFNTSPASVTRPPSITPWLKPDTSLHQHYASTPLHTQPLLPHVQLGSSLHNTVSDSQRLTSESPGNHELHHLHLSPDSEPCCEQRLSPGLQSSKRRGESFSQNQNSPEIMEKDSSFQQCFMDMDDPPIAFNDSWGFDVCPEPNPENFSLRMNDSGSTSSPEASPEKPGPSSSSSSSRSPRSCPGVRSVNSSRRKTVPSPLKGPHPKLTNSLQPPLATPPVNRPSSLGVDEGVLESKVWDSWEEEEEEEALPLSQRVIPTTGIKTPAQNKGGRMVVPITPMPHYSDMDTPELKNKLNRFGVRPLPKRQMILKLKEIHQYTHQLTSSDSEDEEPPAALDAQVKLLPSRGVSGAKAVQFKEPTAPPAPSPRKRKGKEDEEYLLAASQGSNTSSTAASEESERSNPELCKSSDGDSDNDGITASQTESRLQDRLQAVRTFILSNPELYRRILEYEPLVLSQLQQQLRAAGIRLGAAKLVDYLDSQCITFTTAKPGQPTASRRRGHKTRPGDKSRRKGVKSVL